MNVLVINGSPRLAASNTMKLTNAFISAAPQDAVIKTVQIYKKNIQPCRGCFSCWGKTAGSCIINDDMRDILTDMLWAALESNDLNTFWYDKCYTPLYLNGLGP